MTTRREDNQPVVFYAPIPPDSDHQNYVVLPIYHRHPHPNRHLRCYLFISAVLILLVTAGYLLYPSDPDLTLSRIHLKNIQVHYNSPKPSLDLSLSLSLRVFNRDFFSLQYYFLVVAVGYRGEKLGIVTSDGGRVRARGTSYVNTTLELDGFQVIQDVFYLLEDLARGSIPFDTDSIIEGKVGLLFFQVPFKARMWCEVYVDTKNQTVIRQDCYPK